MASSRAVYTPFLAGAFRHDQLAAEVRDAPPRSGREPLRETAKGPLLILPLTFLGVAATTDAPLSVCLAAGVVVWLALVGWRGSATRDAAP